MSFMRRRISTFLRRIPLVGSAFATRENRAATPEENARLHADEEEVRRRAETLRKQALLKEKAKASKFTIQSTSDGPSKDTAGTSQDDSTPPE